MVTRGLRGKSDSGSDGARDADGLTICDLPLDSVNFLYTDIYIYICATRIVDYRGVEGLSRGG